MAKSPDAENIAYAVEYLEQAETLLKPLLTSASESDTKNMVAKLISDAIDVLENGF